MTPNVFLLLNLVLAFYNVGTIWAHEVDIFRTWKLINPEDFPKVQTAHWRKLPYWIFTPVGLALCGGVVLVWYHPSSSPVWAIWANLICQALPCEKLSTRIAMLAIPKTLTAIIAGVDCRSA